MQRRKTRNPETRRDVSEKRTERVEIPSDGETPSDDSELPMIERPAPEWSSITTDLPKGAASLLFFYFGDSPILTLFQETLSLSTAFEGYDRKVLLKFELEGPAKILSERAVSMADVVADPTADNLVAQLKDLANRGYMVDLWILGHGYNDNEDNEDDPKKKGFRVSAGRMGENERFTARDIQRNFGMKANDFKKFPLRMVYQVNCYGSSMNEVWHNLGARVVCGPRYVNYYPNQFDRFASYWNKGLPFVYALENSNTSASREIIQDFMLLLASATHQYAQQNAVANILAKIFSGGTAPIVSVDLRDALELSWEACKNPPHSILGDKQCCAKAFFTGVWEHSGWQSDGSGRENMDYSSHMLFRCKEGDGTKITRDFKITWEK